MGSFAKVHGNGNDFIVLENLDDHYSSEELGRLARLLCRRKFSIGADGVLVAEKDKTPACSEVDFSMRIFNADGSEGEMCGNGARALARYAFEKKLAGASMCFSTLAGLVKARVEPPYAELDMGELDLSQGVFGRCVKSHGLEFPYVFLTVGVPHCILFTDDYDVLDSIAKTAIGREISHDYALFPLGSNVSFAQMLPGGNAKAVTYERGVEELTESCGTGSVAVAVAFNIVGEAGPAVRVHNPGGINDVRLLFSSDNKSCHAWLKGKTAIVAEGIFGEEALL